MKRKIKEKIKNALCKLKNKVEIILYKVKNFLLKVFPYDKLLHFWVGMVLYLFLEKLLSGWVSIISIIFLALLVELFDKISKKGTPEYMDVIYTAAGAILTMLLIW